MARSLRDLPSVDRLLADDRIIRLAEAHGQGIGVDACTRALERDPRRLRSGGRVRAGRLEIEELLRPRLRRKINATGVVGHTNLGRAPLAETVLARRGGADLVERLRREPLQRVLRSGARLRPDESGRTPCRFETAPTHV